MTIVIGFGLLWTVLKVYFFYKWLTRPSVIARGARRIYGL